MKRQGLLAAAGLILISNAVTLVGVSRNRASAVQTIELTERELTLGFQVEEDSGIDLRLNTSFQPSGFWFDDAKLQEIGLSTTLPPEGVFIEVPARAAYVALEYDGPAWQAVSSRELSRTGVAAAYVEAQSHLVPVDVSRSPETLLAKYGSTGKHLIVRATVTSVVDFRDGKRAMQGRIAEILPQDIHVPLPAALVLEKSSPRRSHYVVRLADGAHFEPWVVSVTTLPK